MAVAAPRTIREVQQEMGNNTGYNANVIWDLLRSSDRSILMDKVAQLIPDQEKGQKAIEEMRKCIVDSVWEQRKYTNGNSLSYIFYVMVTTEENHLLAPRSTKFSCHPVFRCRKCHSETGNTTDHCMIYVDETGRVYQDWQSYVENNVLPAGTMVTPRHGVYTFDLERNVCLDVYCTPRNTTGAKAMDVAQKGSAVLGIGSAAVSIAALCSLPVAAPVVAAAGVVGAGVAGFSAISSLFYLKDRADHNQSINITNRQVQGTYLNIAAGCVGMAAAGATRVMSSMAATGKATVGIEALVNGINITSIVLSGTGVANGVLDLILKYNDDDSITTLDVLQLSASLVLFTHSVYNFRLASTIANEARTNTIRTYRESLSNNQRKMFDKMSKETMRIRGTTQGKMDIIRNVNKIPDRQYLNDLFKINKQLNAKNVRPAFGGANDPVLLNNELAVDPAILRQNVQHNVGPSLLDQVQQPIPPTASVNSVNADIGFGGRVMLGNIALRDTANEAKAAEFFDQPVVGNGKDFWKKVVILFPCGVQIALSAFNEKFISGIVEGRRFIDVVEAMAKNMARETLCWLMHFCEEFLKTAMVEIEQVVGVFISTESVLYQMLKQILRHYEDLSLEFLRNAQNEINQRLRTYYLSFNPNGSTSPVVCTKCGGFYREKTL